MATIKDRLNKIRSGQAEEGEQNSSPSIADRIGNIRSSQQTTSGGIHGTYGISVRKDNSKEEKYSTARKNAIDLSSSSNTPRYNSLKEYDNALAEMRKSLENPTSALYQNQFDDIKSDTNRLLEYVDLNAAQTAFNDYSNLTPYKTNEQKAYEKLQAERNKYALEHAFEVYADNQKNTDYGTLSQFVSNTDDLRYQYINGGKEAATRYIQSKGYNNTDAVTESAKVEAMDSLDYMTEEEKQMYRYLYAKNPADADKYIKDMQMTFDKRRTEAYTAEARARAEEGGVVSNILGSAATIVPKMVGGVIAGASHLLSGDSNPYSRDQLLLNYTNEYRDAVGDKIENNTEGWGTIFGQNTARFLYDTGMSMLDSATGALIAGATEGLGGIAGAVGKNFYGASMGLGAGSERMKELVESGATDEQAFWGGTLSGIAEGFFEEYSLEKLISVKNTSTVREWFKNFAKQAFTEGSEEVFTEIANTIIDGINRGAASDYESNVDEYINRGYSEEIARQMATKDVAKQVALAGLGGAISGGVLGGVNSGMQYASFASEGRKMKKNNVNAQKIADIASNMSPDSEAYKAAQGFDTNKVSNAQMGNLKVQTIEEAKSQLNDALSSGDIGKQIEAIGTINKLDAALESDNAMSNTADIKRGKTNSFDGKITNIVKKNGEMYLKTTRGNEVSLRDATLDAQTRELVGYAMEKKGTERVAFLSNYESGSVSQYSTAFDLVYAKASLGMDRTGITMSSLSDSQIDAIYNAAAEHKQAMIDTAETIQQEKILKGYDPEAEYKVGVFDMSEIKGKELTAEMNEHVNVAKKFLDSTGLSVNVKMFMSEADENGKLSAEQGWYDEATNTLHIDVRAGFTSLTEGSTQILQTVSHELTHWAEKKSPKLYSQLSNHILDTYAAAKGISREELIYSEIARLSEVYKKAGIKSEVTEKVAVSEITARGCEDMLTNEKSMKRLSQQMARKQTKRFMEKIREIYGKIAEFFRSLAEKYKSSSDVAKTMRENAEAFEKQAEYWADMIEQASRVGQADLETLNEGKLFAIRPQFYNEFDEWVKTGYPKLKALAQQNDALLRKTKKGARFFVGTTSDVLQKLGANKVDIYITKPKIVLDVIDHPDINISDFRKVPQILEHPILVLKSKNVGRGNKTNDRIVVIGEASVPSQVKPNNPNVSATSPLVVVLSLGDYGMNDSYFVNVNKIASVYAKTMKPIDFLKSSEVIYVNEKKAPRLLSFIGFSAPIKLAKGGFVGKIVPQPHGRVNIQGDSFNNIFQNRATGGVLYSLRDSEGNTLSEQQAEYFADSKVRDKDGNLLVMYHGTPNEFTVFDPVKFGGKNGVQEGFGIYMSSDASVAKTYGDKTIKGYVNITNPARSDKKTLTTAKVAKLIEKTVKKQAEELMVDGGYKSVNDAMKDTWVSNGVDTYSLPLSTAIREAAAQFVKYDENDMDIIRSIMATYPIRDYESAYEFYDILKDTLGFDGFITEWENRENGEKTTIALPLNSNQIKNVDNENPTSNVDIRYSMRDSEGKELTPSQQSFFELSQVRDEAGQLLPMYHGTNNAGFTVFKGENGISSRAFFFTDNLETARGYSGTHDIFNAKTFKNKAELIKAIEKDMRAENIEVKKTDAGYELYENGEYVDIRSNLDDLYQAYNEYSGFGGDSANYKVYLNVINPLVIDAKGSNWEAIKVDFSDDTMTTNAIAEYALNNGYDGVIIRNVEDNGLYASSRNKFDLATDVIVFDSAQIKSVDNENPTGSDDIRYSLREQDDIYSLAGDMVKLQKDNERLTRDIQMLKERIALDRKLTKGMIPDKKAIKTTVNKFIKSTDLIVDADSLTERFADLYTQMFNEEALEDGTFAMAVTELANELAKNVRTENMYEGYDSLLKHIRSTKLRLTDTQYGDAVHSAGGKKELSRMLQGKIHVSIEEGTSLDSFYTELVGDYPELFSEVAEDDQLMTLLDTYNDIRDAQTVVQVHEDLDLQRYLQSELYNVIWQLPTIKTTADRWQAKVNKLRQENYQMMQDMRAERKSFKEQLQNQKRTDAVRYGEVIKNLREQRDTRRAEAMAYGRKRLSDYRERLAKDKEIKKITEKAKTLMDWFNTNSKDKHIPDILKEPVANFLTALDFSSRQLLKKGEPTRKDISLSGSLEKLAGFVNRAANAQNLNEDIEAYANIYLDIPVEFAQEFDKLSTELNDIQRRMGDNEMVLNEMSLEQLQELRRCITILKTIVTKTNKLLVNLRYAHVNEAAEASMRELQEMGNKGKVKGKIDNFLNFDNALPYYAFERFGSGGKAIFEAMQDGWDKFAFNIRDIMEFTEKAYTEEQVKEWTKEVKEFKLKDKEVKMTTAQLMSLYCLSRREQALGHIHGGGIRIADIDVKGAKISQANAFTVSQSELANMLKELTAEQIEVAKKLQSFMSGVCSEWGNEVTLIRYGIKSFSEENYFPIESDPNNLAKDAQDNKNSFFRLLNMGFTKNVTKNANNSIMLRDIFDVFAQHSSDMAKYNSLALPTLDAFKWFSYKVKGEKNEEGNFTTESLRGTMDEALGKNAKRYVSEFLKDLNNAQEAGREIDFVSKLMSNYKVGAVAFNLRVALLQPTAYARASAVLSASDMAAGFSKKASTAKAQKYCGMAYWKSLGYYSTDVQKGIADKIKHNETFRDKFVDAGMWMAEKGDEFTWGHLWNACEHYIKRNNPDVKTDSEEFNQMVAKKLREVIYKSQVVDSTMTRTQIMRSKSGLTKLFTAFMSEPSISYNMLLDAVNKFKDESLKSNKATAWNLTKGVIGKAAVAYLLTATCNALAEAIIDALRDVEITDDDDDWADAYGRKFGDKFWENFVEDMSILAKLPRIKDIYSISKIGDLESWVINENRRRSREGEEALTGEEIRIKYGKYLTSYDFGNSRMDSAVLETMKKLGGEFTKIINGKDVKPYQTAYTMAQTIAQTTGLPLATIVREMEVLWDNSVGTIYPNMKLKGMTIEQ